MHGFVAALRTSAKTGHNINTSFSMLVRQIFVQEFSMSNARDTMQPNEEEMIGLRATGKSSVKQSFRLDENLEARASTKKRKEKQSKCC